MQQKAIALRLDNVSHFYGKKAALEQVSFTLEKGTTVGLIGPDGVGKSTLLSLIAGVKILQQGAITVFEQNVANKAEREALTHQIAFMPQGLGKNLYLTLSVYDNVDFHARLFGLSRSQRKAKIQRLLKATGLLPFADRPAGKLSGGMKQKLSLCCALVHSPDLLILDEPTTGVDPLSRRQFWQLVAELRAESPEMTVIVATAYIDEAENFEQVLAMDNGKVIAHQPTQQLIAAMQAENLEQAYVKLLPPEKRGAENGIDIPPFQPSPNEPPAIIAKGLSKKFGDFVSVDNVSFEIPKGEIFGFLGSNGCGKSTTMKMLTGLLDPTKGEATLLGQPINASDINTRKRVGYMSQAFSLYEELSVKENLLLHAKLYQLPQAEWENEIQAALAQFDLLDTAEATPADLPLGIRQRLQLAAACLHKPEVLILDEPTSGVDPAARDMFWSYLIKLSRDDLITIFVTTHFMNEAARCDRISLMHRGKVLAVGTPEALRREKQADSLEQAFIKYLEEQTDEMSQSEPIANLESEEEPIQAVGFWQKFTNYFSVITTFSLRESKELLRDKIRLLFALLGPLTMLLSMGSSISFDINPLKMAVLDHDNSSESRKLVEYFRGSRYFLLQDNLSSIDEISTTLQAGKVRIVLEIPADFGRNLLRQQQPEIGLFIDGAFPSTAENLNGSAAGVITQYVREMQKQTAGNASISLIEPRMVYNQDFKSVYAMTPGIIMLAMVMIPTMMTALSVVREKEMGSIMNLYGSPASPFQFLLGKQIPYIALAFISYLVLVLNAILVFEVPIKGSIPAMFFGVLLGICASTSFGLLISSFVKSQVAAIFAAAIISVVPAVNFSGVMYPVSRLDDNVQIATKIFPGAWFQQISLGGFTKGLSFAQFEQSYIALAVIYFVYLTLATLALKKQET